MPSDRPNVLLLTVDDLNYDTPGCMGNPMDDVTPHLDDLASQGYLFQQAYGTYPICGPARHSIFTGLYPHHHGHMGHGDVPPKWWERAHGDREITGLSTRFQEQGYVTATANKHGWAGAEWDLDEFVTVAGRDPERCYDLTQDTIEVATDRGDPFFLNVNVVDPHRYWAGAPNESPEWAERTLDSGAEAVEDSDGASLPWPDPPRSVDPEDVFVPPQYPDEPEIRERLTYYYDSVARMDESIGRTLQALEDSGHGEDTIVVFVGDHGIAWAYGKWSLYPSGVRTPVIVRWPGVVESGQRDSSHLFSTVDIVPTLCDLVDIDVPEALDGHSAAPLARGETTDWPRSEAFSCFNYMNISHPSSSIGEAEREEYVRDLASRTQQYRPMRALHTAEYTYIWNGWPGDHRYLPIEMGSNSPVLRILEQKAEPDQYLHLGDIWGKHGSSSRTDESEYPDYAERIDCYRFRTTEELYETVSDPGCLQNLARDPEYADTLATFRSKMHTFLAETDDHEFDNYDAFLRERDRNPQA
jgi:N-sulfoglucosamine sulfohydrolase